MFPGRKRIDTHSPVCYTGKKPRGSRIMKRADYINWDEYFMGIAMLAARRSKDPNTQVGA